MSVGAGREFLAVLDRPQSATKSCERCGARMSRFTRSR